MRIEIPPPDSRVEEACRRRWDRLTKPVGSLGRLEELGARLAGMTGRPVPSARRKVIFVAAADHGVAADGVSAYPQSVTGQMVENFLRGGAAINVLARQAGAEVAVIDAGVIGQGEAEGLIRCGVRAGTASFFREPAMRREEAEAIVQAGMEIFRKFHESAPVDLVGLGDMGIGNTTPAAALTALFTGAPAARVTGRGTGVDDERLLLKTRGIEAALRLHRPDPADPMGCLAAVGGLEIGCLAGITLAAAQARVPVVLDGFITTSAALLACRLAPEAAGYLVASHRSVEPGHRVLLEELGLEPLLDLQLRLGEGTGAALAFGLVDSAVRLLSEMATFDEAGVEEKST